MIDAALTHAWSGIALEYAAVQVPMIVGLIRVRAQLRDPVGNRDLDRQVSVGRYRQTAVSTSLSA